MLQKQKILLKGFFKVKKINDRKKETTEKFLGEKIAANDSIFPDQISWEKGFGRFLRHFLPVKKVL